MFSSFDSRWAYFARSFSGAALLCVVALRSHGAVPVEQLEAVVQKHVAAQQFSGAVLVAQRGTPLFDRAYGFANREWDIPNTPATRFRIGSITKQFTAVAILRLEERGKLKLGDPVSAHWPEAPEAWSQITLHHLLTHTSGIPNVTRDPEFVRWKFQPTTVREMVGRFRDRPLDFPAGDRHVYSNSNYLVLGLILERISGQTFGDFLRSQVLEPLGLENTGVESGLEILPRRASGYWLRGERIVNAPYSDMSVPHAAGAMYSTTHDLWRWAEAMFGETSRLLSPAARTKLLTPALDNYALGVRVADFKGRKLIEHGGNISGFSSYLRYYPESGVTVVVLSNLTTGRGVEALLTELATVALEAADPARPKRQPVVVPAALLGSYAGVYEIRPGHTVTFRLIDGALTAQPSGREPMPVFAESETKFYFEAVDTEIEFARGEDGRVTHLVMKRDGRSRQAPRIGD